MDYAGPARAQNPNARGYVTDVLYARNFIRQTAPAWLDHVALIAGLSPPERDCGFTWCDLGCGHGMTAAVLAAPHPNGEFHGIDVMPSHIDAARQFAAEAGIPNVRFHAADFDTAAGFDFPGFDYIVSHGVYAWVDESVRQSWRRFIGRHLKPGGLLYVSYNAMPGRAADLPLQRLVRTLGRSMAGNSSEQVLFALGVARLMTDLKVPALVSSPMANRMMEHGEQFSPAYLAHELMASPWEPMCVSDVRAFLAGEGLRPVGSATLVENYDNFVLGRSAREILAGIADPDARELARDFFIDQFFRRDVFIREGRRLHEGERRRRLMQSAFFLSQPAARVEYCMSTPAGHLSFDNAAARHIVQALTAGPRALAEIADPSIPDQDLLANALTLCASGALWPVEAGRVSVETLNQAIRGPIGALGEVRYLALPCGTAISAGSGLSGDEYSDWARLQAGT